MTKNLTSWTDLRMDFFLEEVLKRFWNHSGKTVDWILEIQYFPALLIGDHNRRAFIGAAITLDFPYSKRKDTIKSNLLKDGDLETLRTYEKNHALGFVMTGDSDYPIDCVTLSYGIEEAERIFLQNFGIGVEPESNPIYLWYNVDKKGKPDFSIIDPLPTRRIRIRYVGVEYFMKTMKELKENDYKFPPEFTKEDAV